MHSFLLYINVQNQSHSHLLPIPKFLLFPLHCKHTAKHTHRRQKRETGEKRMATGAAAIMLQCAFEGTISMHDMDIERKPYHRNCGCALHKLKGVCHNACSQRRNISFPKKQSWNDCSLSIEISTPSSQSSSLNDSSVNSRKDANEALLQR